MGVGTRVMRTDLVENDAHMIFHFTRGTAARP